MAVRPPRARVSPLVDIVKTLIIVAGAVISLLGLLATIWGVSYAFARDGGGLETVRYCDKPCQAGEALISNGVCMTCVNLFETANTISLSNTLACAAAGTCPVVNGFGSNLTVAAYAAAGLISINKTGGVIVISADLPSGTLPLCGACALQQSLRLAISGTCYECYTPTLSCTGGAGFCAVEDGVGGTQVLKKFVADDGMSISDYGNGTLRWHANVPSLPLQATGSLHVQGHPGSATVSSWPGMARDSFVTVVSSGYTSYAGTIWWWTWPELTTAVPGTDVLGVAVPAVNNTVAVKMLYSVAAGFTVPNDGLPHEVSVALDVDHLSYGMASGSMFWNGVAYVLTGGGDCLCHAMTLPTNAAAPLQPVFGTCTILTNFFGGGSALYIYMYVTYDQAYDIMTVNCNLDTRIVVNSSLPLLGPYDNGTPFF